MIRCLSIEINGPGYSNHETIVLRTRVLGVHFLRFLIKHLRFQIFVSTEESFFGLGYPGTVILYSVPWIRRRVPGF